MATDAKEHYQERTDRRKDAIDDMTDRNAKKGFGKDNPDGKISEVEPTNSPLPESSE